jgi:hypothetical protein
MNKVLMMLLSAGVTYLLNNKDARQKLVGSIQSMTSKSKQKTQTYSETVN